MNEEGHSRLDTYHNDVRAAYKTLEQKLRNKKLSPYEILGDIEKYLSWFVPIITSLYFIIIGVTLKYDEAKILFTNPIAIAGLSLLFASLLTAVLSKFFIFHFNKLRSDTTVNIEEWGMRFFKQGQKHIEIRSKLFERYKDAIIEGIIPEEIRNDEELQDHAEALIDLLSKGLLDAIMPGMVKKLDNISDPEKQKELIEAAKEKGIRFWNMKTGWGRLGITAFYFSNYFFIASLIAWFLYIIYIAIV